MTGLRARLAAGAVVAAVLVTSGCGFSLADLPSTGGVSGPTYRITARFADAGDLTVGAKVKLHGVVIGQVAAISAHHFRADVAIDVSRTFALPAGSNFQIRFTTPLGEDFVAVTPPAHPSGTVLADGATVGERHTTQAPTIEDTFAALSLLLNGGGLDKLQVIVGELGTALHGNTGAARDLIGRLGTLVGDLDAHSGDIDRLLDGLGELSGTLDRRRGLIDTALRQFPHTLDLVANDTGRIRALLGELDDLGASVRDLLDRGEKAMLADFDALRPTLDALADGRDTLIPTFNSLVRFGTLFDRATPGDYLNLAIVVQVLFDAPPQHPRDPGSTGANTPAARTRAGAVTSLLTGGLRRAPAGGRP